jgi:hypothetical protein
MCEKTLKKLSDDNYGMLKLIDGHVFNIFKDNTRVITKATTETVQKCLEIQTSAKKRSKSYFDRKKTIDWLVYLNLGLTPIFLILLYLKK